MLEPGTLWARAKKTTQRALAVGTLQPLATDHEFVEQDGVRFVVRILSTLALKDALGNATIDATPDVARLRSPFLSYDKDLFVADFSESHVCLLNKFNVIDNHLVVVTRSYEDQESLLTLQDFEAIWACMMEFDGLAFYNAGRDAGASQRHKHLQIVPLPLAPSGPGIPMEPLLEPAIERDAVGTAPGLPFVHAVSPLEWSEESSVSEAAAAILERYHAMLREAGVGTRTTPAGKTAARAYNLIVTRRWMLLVPRVRGRFESISVNSLGFAGSMLVRDGSEVALVRDRGPMDILRHVAMPIGSV